MSSVLNQVPLRGASLLRRGEKLQKKSLLCCWAENSLNVLIIGIWKWFPTDGVARINFFSFFFYWENSCWLHLLLAKDFLISLTTICWEREKPSVNVLALPMVGIKPGLSACKYVLYPFHHSLSAGDLKILWYHWQLCRASVLREWAIIRKTYQELTELVL